MKIAFLTTDNREQFSDYDNPVPHFGTAPQALLDGFAKFPNEVEIHVISCTRRKMDTPEALAPNIRFHQLLVPHLGWGRTGFAGCGLAVRRLLCKLKPDVVHAQGTERDCAVSMMFAPCGPRLLTIHGHMARIAEIIDARPFSYYWLVKKLEAMAVRRADGVVAITNYTQGRLRDNARRTWVVPNAVDASFFEVNATGQGDLVICVASLSPWKRQMELIDAFDALPEEIRPQLVLLGVGEESGYGAEVVERLATRPWCSHPGAVNRQELKNWLRKAGLLILPSTEDNCPMVILEAMAAGVPVAASNIGGIPDLIEHGVTGLMFDPQDAKSIQGAVTRWQENPDETAAMAARAKQVAGQRFHPEVIARRHLEIYREALAQSGI
ncbi:MAG: glycosyltransferase family 4 protein [Luteolibacter sp.]|uniref:glycosyltransferase family 4 protein n=1 Tax=Luteolibacter sp. TaxID=1962973 RepID=UPI0032673EAA